MTETHTDAGAVQATVKQSTTHQLTATVRGSGVFRPAPRKENVNGKR
jgi:hypothetical protein